MAQEHRYYFDLHECGRITPDDEGHHYADLAAATSAAIGAAREIMCAEVADGRLCLSCHIAILDRDRQPIQVIKFRDTIVMTGL